MSCTSRKCSIRIQNSNSIMSRRLQHVLSVTYKLSTLTSSEFRSTTVRYWNVLANLSIQGKIQVDYTPPQTVWLPSCSPASGLFCGSASCYEQNQNLDSRRNLVLRVLQPAIRFGYFYQPR